jgi:transposase
MECAVPAAKSRDLRERVVTAYANGEGSFSEVARRFMVGEATVNRWVTAMRKTGRLDPLPKGGSAPKLSEEQRAALRDWVTAECDLTLVQLADRLRDTFGVDVSITTVSRWLIRMGFTLKKSPRSSRHERRSG